MAGRKNSLDVSVIVPTCNRHGFLRESVLSVLNQTFHGLEVIVVNDGGKGVGRLLAGLHDHRIRWHDLPERMGPSHARNVGLRMARGEYICFLDDDDIFFPGHVGALVAAMRKTGSLVAYTDSVKAVMKKRGGRYVVVHRAPYFTEDFFLLKLLLTNYFPINCVMFHKKCIADGIFFDQGIHTHEDWDFWIRIALLHPFHHVKKQSVEVRFRYDKSTATSRLQEDFKKTVELVPRRYQKELLREIENAIAKPALNGREAFWLGMGLKRMKRLKEASTYFLLAVQNGETPRELADASFNLGAVLMEVNNQAGTGFLKQIREKSARDMYLIGERTYQLGDYDESASWLQRAVTDGGLPLEQVTAAYFRLGEICNKRGQKDQAEGFIRKGLGILVRERGKSGKEMYRIASFHRALGNNALAARWYKRALAGSIQEDIRAGAYFHLGKIAAEGGKMVNAREYFKLCLLVLPTHQQALKSLHALVV
jgi:glycosyltransferase involved in cell wall biosynthesis